MRATERLDYVNWRLYWVLAPGALIVGLAWDVYIAAGALLFALTLRAIYLQSYIEIVLLLPWSLLGGLLHNTPDKDIISGRVTLTSETHMYVTCNDGSYLRIKAREPVSPGSWIKARVTYWRVPIMPGASRPNAMQLKQYIAVERGEPGYRHALYSALHADLSPDAAALASALLVGINNPSNQLREYFAQSGLAHLLAISGLHITIVCGGLYTILRRALLCTVGYGANIALMISLAVGLGYGVLAGAGISLMRAWCMFAVSGTALACGRLTDPIRICGLTACLLLSLYPDQWYTPSFVLSFVTTAALISGNVLTSYLLIAPYSLHYFFQLPLQPFVANTLALPLLTFVIMPCLLLHTTALTIESHVLVPVLEWALGVLVWIAQLPLSYSATAGVQHPVGIFVWTLSVLTFVGLRRYATLIPGVMMVLGSLLCSGVHEPVAMKYGSVVGLWDGRGTLWVSEKGAWVTERWAAAVGAQEIQIMPHDNPEWRWADGCTWLPGGVWFGRSDRHTPPPAGARVRIWQNKPRYARQQPGVYDITDDAAWVWLHSLRTWRANN